MSHAKVVVEESVVRVITVGQQGPPGPAGEDGAETDRLVISLSPFDSTSRAVDIPPPLVEALTLLP